jgi:hypothetical protein
VAAAALAAALLLASAVVLMTAIAPPATAAPPPRDTCGACADDFEDAAAAAGGEVTVASSAMDVSVAGNGSARVEVAVDVGPDDADWVAANADAVVAELAADGGGLAPVPRDATVQTADGVATVRYDAPEFAHTSAGGVVVVDAFADGRTTGWRVTGDQLRLHAPQGYVVTHGPAATPTVAWTTGEAIDDAHLVYAPGDGATPTAATQFALAVETGPAFLRAAALALAPALVVLALVWRSVDATATRFGDWDARTLGTATAVTSALAAVALVAAGPVSTYVPLQGTAPLVTALTGVSVGSLAATGRLNTDRSVAAAAVGLPLVLGTIAAAVGAVRHPGVASWTVGRGLASGLLAAQLGAFVVLGATRDRTGSSAWRRYAAVAAPPIGVVALLGPAPVLYGWLLVVLLAAHPAYWLGASVAPRLRSV